jgi:DNA-directed RNA polymerase specialized sigma24 family protein
MRSPSPSDLCWVIGITPQGRWIMPVMRDAVRVQWPEAQQITVANLGDDTLARELMEQAIRQTTEHLETMDPVGVDQARALLARHFRNAVRRRSRAERKFSFRGSATDVEVLSQPIAPAARAVEATLDLRTLLRDTPPDIRRAMLMRYGARNRWEEIGRELAKSKDAIRMSCQRELSRIRKRIGIGEDVE